MIRIIRVAAVLIAVAVSYAANGQDIRTTGTKVADLLAQMPAADQASTSKYMDDLFKLGIDGLNMVCSQVVPAGTDNDVAVRFAIEALSRHLSAPRIAVSDKLLWEKVCLDWIARSTDTEVKTFFISQLQYVGSDSSTETMASLMENKELAEPAVAIIVATGTKLSAETLIRMLANSDNRAVISTLNGLALLNSQVITPEMLSFATSPQPDVRAAAFRALAATGNEQAVKVLTAAATGVSWGWEPTGAVAALIELADNMGAAGNLKSMDKLIKLVNSKCTKTGSTHYLAAALSVSVRHHGVNAHKQLLKTMKSSDPEYRGAAMRLASELPGETYTAEWTGALNSFKGKPRAEIISMLGDRRDRSASHTVTALLNDSDPLIRQTAAEAIAKISGREAIPALTDYLLTFENSDDQEAAAGSLVTLLEAESLRTLAGKLPTARPVAQGTIIGLLSWSRNEEFFTAVLPLIESEDDGVRSSAFLALKNLAPESALPELLNLLRTKQLKHENNEIRLAIAAALRNNPDTEGRADQLILSLKEPALKQQIIPILAMLGGERAVNAVLNEFENGDAPTRDTAFEALIYWNDYHSLNALYDICASGNKTFASAAFNSYIRQIASAPVTADQKLLFIKKIAPYALTLDQKEKLIESAGNVRTYLSLFFVAKYLDDVALAPTASRIAMRIALPASGETSGMTGTLVREILEKSIAGISGNESEYDKERIRKYIATMPEEVGFEPMFNGVDLTGWQGLVGTPLTRAKMTPAELAARQKVADQKALQNWSVRDGMIWFSGNGDNLCSIKKYGDFELLLDWIITKHGDSGIYLRGSPQVQIWDTSRVDVGAQVGSGGLYNNQKHPSKPLVVADNQVGEWNTFRITMVGERVNVWLNGILVVDNVVLENYWDRSIPIFPVESIELQAHGTDLAFRDIFVREIQESEYNLTPAEKAEGFTALFNGKNLDGWIGDKVSYVAEDGMIVIKPEKGSGGNLFTAEEYGDFVFRFEFQLTPGANNGLGIRAPLEGDAAYVGMELQILDNTAAIYANLAPYQYHGSVYGVIPAKRGYLNPVGEWNFQEVVAKGNRITITLNGTVIVDGDIAEASANGTIDGHDHPGLKRARGHIGFLGHGSVVRFRNIRVKEL
jgi:HEAT repeat protein